ARAVRAARPACRPRAAPRGTEDRRRRIGVAPRSSAEAQLVPGRSRCELEQRAAAVRIGVAEVAVRIVPRDLEQPDLDAVVEPRAAEDELLQPVDERLAVDEGDPLPVADEGAAEPGARR